MQGPDCIGGPWGHPLQYSCLGDSMDRGGWRVAVHRVVKSQTWLKWLSKHLACPCRRHGFNPKKIPHAMKPLNPYTTTTEPMLESQPMSRNYWSQALQLVLVCLKPMLCNKRSHPNEKPKHGSKEEPPIAATREESVQQKVCTDPV